MTLFYTVRIMEEGKGDFIYHGVEAQCKGEAMREMVEFHRDWMKVPGEIELVATARIEEMSEVKWFEKGDIGDQIRDLLDYCDYEDAAKGMARLGLNGDEIQWVFDMEEEYA